MCSKSGLNWIQLLNWLFLVLGTGWIYPLHLLQNHLRKEVAVVCSEGACPCSLPASSSALWPQWVALLQHHYHLKPWYCLTRVSRPNTETSKQNKPFLLQTGSPVPVSAVKPWLAQRWERCGLHRGEQYILGQTTNLSELQLPHGASDNHSEINRLTAINAKSGSHK